MALQHVRLDQIGQAELQRLIDSKTSETRDIEYKRDTYGNSDKDHAEYLADISSFANTTGGDIVIGMAATNGIPTGLAPLTEDPDAEILRLENIARSGLQPRIFNLAMRAVPLTGGGSAIVIRVPRSYNPPHRIIRQGTGQNRFQGKTRTGRLWSYVRDDQPFGGRDPPAAAFLYSRDRSGEHPERHLASQAGLMQADAYAGFNRLYEAGRKPGLIVEAACWAHARRRFFDLARLKKAPIAIKAVKRIDVLFAIEREINGLSPDERLAVRAKRSRPLVHELEIWLREQRAKLSSNNDTAKAIDYTRSAPSLK